MDGHVLKFTQDGKFVMQVGKKGVTRDSIAQEHFFQVAKMFFYANDERSLRRRRLRQPAASP